jgi:hypothetical protein
MFYAHLFTQRVGTAKPSYLLAMFPWKKALHASNALLLACVLLGPRVSGKAATGPPSPREDSSPTPREGKHVLGCIYDGQGRVRYYVVTHFYRVQAARMMHGHSRVLFLSPQHVVMAQYELSMPEELPYKLIRNTLFFGQALAKGHQHQQRVDVLPLSLCVEPNNCYRKEPPEVE